MISIFLTKFIYNYRGGLIDKFMSNTNKIRIDHLVRMFRTGLIKKALEKFKLLSLRNKIDVTNDRICY